MILDNETKIALTYELSGETIVRKGDYKSAEITVKNGWTNKEEVSINRPMKMISAPIYSKATQTTTLGNEFVKMALSRPSKPSKQNVNAWLRTPMGKLASGWRKLSDEEKIRSHVELYVDSMGGGKFEFSVL